MVDIRPVTMRDPDAVVDAVRREVDTRGAGGAYLVGWIRCCRPACPIPR
jgi:hypothetical protein